MSIGNSNFISRWVLYGLQLLEKFNNLSKAKGEKKTNAFDLINLFHL